MRLLLDTHRFLWFVNGDIRLSTNARTLLADISNPLFLSVASLWEMAIKVSIRKLALDQPFETLIPKQIEANDIDILGIELSHIIEVARLPLHHRDPFDRLLVAQATIEQLPIVSGDPSFDAYGITRLW